MHRAQVRCFSEDEAKRRTRSTVARSSRGPRRRAPVPHLAPYRAGRPSASGPAVSQWCSEQREGADARAGRARAGRAAEPGSRSRLGRTRAPQMTVAIVSGGNLDANLLARLINRRETRIRRRLRLYTRVPDRPRRSRPATQHHRPGRCERDRTRPRPRRCEPTAGADRRRALARASRRWARRCPRPAAQRGRIRVTPPR